MLRAASSARPPGQRRSAAVGQFRDVDAWQFVVLSSCVRADAPLALLLAASVVVVRLPGDPAALRAGSGAGLLPHRGHDPACRQCGKIRRRANCRCRPTAPLLVDENSPPPAWDLSLAEAVQLGLENSKVLRDLGGSVLRTPGLAQTIHDPAIQATDPRFGMEGRWRRSTRNWRRGCGLQQRPGVQQPVCRRRHVPVQAGSRQLRDRALQDHGHGRHVRRPAPHRLRRQQRPGQRVSQLLQRQLTNANFASRCCRAAASSSTASPAPTPRPAWSTAWSSRGSTTTSARPNSKSPCATRSATSKTAIGTCTTPIASWTPRSRPATRA